MNLERSIDFIKKHADFFTVLGLCIICYFIFFHNIGNYALMDVDENQICCNVQRYVSHKRFFNSVFKTGLLL